MDESQQKELLETIEVIPELPVSRLVTFSRLWQFETWLRQRVYVELRAKYGDDWKDHLVGYADYIKENDLLLTHMPGPEKLYMSFITFGSLTKTISKEWDLYSSYLPPQSIWDAKIEEVSQVRNRIAHFRRGNVDDLQRVIQLLRDVDKGFFKFCTSINESIYPLSMDTNDPIIHHFSQLNPYVHDDNNDSYNSIYSHYAHSFEIKIEIIDRPWSPKPTDHSQVIGCPGFFYDLNIHCHDTRIINYKDLLHSTVSLHDSLLYIILSSSEDHLRAIFPSILGKDALIQYIDAFIGAVANNMRPGRAERSPSEDLVKKEEDKVQRFADSCPEYVIGPKNPLSFLDPSIECSFFEA